MTTPCEHTYDLISIKIDHQTEIKTLVLNSSIVNLKLYDRILTDHHFEFRLGSLAPLSGFGFTILNCSMILYVCVWFFFVIVQCCIEYKL